MKRGLSPLIAVVLIIGFTVAIAAVIMTWGTGFVRTMQKTTEEAAERELTLAVDAVLYIRKAELRGNQIRLIVENTGSMEIKSIMVRIYGSDGIDTVKKGGLEAYEITNFWVDFDFSKTGMVEKIEAIPVVNYKGENVTCTNCAAEETKFEYPSDILTNGGFEEDFTKWGYNNDYRGTSSITTTEVYEGSKAVGVKSYSGEWTATYQSIFPADGFEKGYNYFVTMKCKTNVGHNCYTFLGDYINYGIYATSKSKAGTGNWETLYVSLYIPSDAPTTRIGVYVYGQAGGAGTTYYDSIKLYKYK